MGGVHAPLSVGKTSKVASVALDRSDFLGGVDRQVALGQPPFWRCLSLFSTRKLTGSAGVHAVYLDGAGCSVPWAVDAQGVLGVVECGF